MSRPRDQQSTSKEEFFDLTDDWKHLPQSPDEREHPRAWDVVERLQPAGVVGNGRRG